MAFRELTDEPWAFIESLRPPQAQTGRPGVDDRKGILIVCRRCDRPCPYGSYPTAWRRPQELQEKGGWEKILQALLDWGYTMGKVKVEEVAIDSTRMEAKSGGAGE